MEKQPLTPEQKKARKIGLIGVGIMSVPYTIAMLIDFGIIDTGIPFLPGHARDLIAVPCYAYARKVLLKKSSLQDELLIGMTIAVAQEDMQLILKLAHIDKLGTWDPWDYLAFGVGAIGLAVGNLKSILREYKQKAKKKINK